MGFFALFPSAPPFGFASVFQLSAFQLLAVASFSTLSSFFFRLPSLFAFALPYGSGFFPFGLSSGLLGYFPFSSLPLSLSVPLPFGFRFFRIFSNPENDTDETLTTSGVSFETFC